MPLILKQPIDLFGLLKAPKLGSLTDEFYYEIFKQFLYINHVSPQYLALETDWCLLDIPDIFLGNCRL